MVIEPVAGGSTSLVDTIDHLLDRGAVLFGDATLSVAGIDLVRVEGRWMVLEDNVRVPSGISYALAARWAMRKLLGRRKQMLAIEKGPSIVLSIGKFDVLGAKPLSHREDLLDMVEILAM